jgi:hypothetical protein
MKTLDFANAVQMAAHMIRSRVIGFSIATEFGKLGIEIAEYHGDPETPHTIYPWNAGQRSKWWVENIDAGNDYYARLHVKMPLGGMNAGQIKMLEFNLTRLFCDMEYMHFSGKERSRLTVSQLDALAGLRSGFGHYDLRKVFGRGYSGKLQAADERGPLAKIFTSGAAEQNRELIERLVDRRLKDMDQANTEATRIWLSFNNGVINNYNCLLLSFIYPDIPVTKEIMKLADTRTAETLFATFKTAAAGNDMTPVHTISSYLETYGQGKAELPMHFNSDAWLEKNWDSAKPEEDIKHIQAAIDKLQSTITQIKKHYKVEEDASND